MTNDSNKSNPDSDVASPLAEASNKVSYQKKPISGICPLCRQHKMLVRSHIIPKFMYKGIKEKEGRFFRLSSHLNKKVSHVQDGIWEHLLCQKCDNERLAPYETSLRKFIYGGIKFKAAKDGDHLRLKDLDYTNLKLALISILWRMSKSTHEFFSAVTLGKNHEDRMRGMIFDGNPGSFLEYPIAVTAPLFEGEFVGDWTLNPHAIRIGKHRVYRCLIGGMIFFIHVSSAEYEPHARELFLHDDGSLLILRKDVKHIEFLNRACRELGEASYAKNIINIVSQTDCG